MRRYKHQLNRTDLVILKRILLQTNTYVAENDHITNHALLEQINRFVKRIDVLLVKDKESYLIALGDAEAWAFYKIMQEVPLKKGSKEERFVKQLLELIQNQAEKISFNHK